MKAFIESVNGGCCASQYQEIEINTGFKHFYAAGDVIFDDKAAYRVEWVAHFQGKSVPVVTKEKLSDYRFMLKPLLTRFCVCFVVRGYLLTVEFFV